MTLAILQWPLFRATDANGLPLAGGKLFSYAAGSSTPLALLAADGTTPLANPVVLNASGQAEVRLGPNAYKLNLLSALDVQQANYPVDNVTNPTNLALLDDYSATVAQMRLQTDPGATGAESLATSLAGELERVRFVLAHLAGTTSWNDAGAIVPGLINVEAYGARAAGSAAANTTAIQAALTAAAAAGTGIFVPGTYAVTTLLVANGVKAIQGPGSFIGTGVVGNAVVELSGTVVGLDYSVNLTMSGGAMRGIYGVAQSCSFHDFQITNFTDVNGHGGIRLRPDSSYVTISNVTIAMVQPPLTAGHTATGLWLESNITDNFGTYFSSGTGASEDPSTPVHHVTVTGCTIFGGSHAVFAQGIRQCTFAGNTIQRSWHRGLALEPACKFNTITGNTIFDFYSSAVLLAYGAQYNVVSGNVCSSTLTNGQAAINLYLGPVGNTITGNAIKVSGIAPLYGIYCAIGATDNLITGNTILGHRYAGIALESDWQNTGSLPATAYYSLPPPGVPFSGTDWAFQTSQHNVVQDNYIGAPTGTAAAGIYVCAMGATFGIDNTVVKGNHVSSTSHDHQWYVFEDSSSQPVANVWLLDNSWNTGFFGMGPRNLAHYKAVKGNYALDYGVVYGFTDGDATPDVTVGNDFLTQNTAGTQITFFDGTMLANREITVRLDLNTGITHDNAKIKLVGGANIAQGAVDSNFFIHFRNLGGGAAGIWTEMWRRN
jgi:hypothetical protein